MKLKSLAKGLLVTAALALTVVATPMSCIQAEAAEGTYTVEKDDYLRKIAKKVYGDEDLWRVIYNANSNVVKSNYIIYKGQVLTIPAVNDTSVPADPTPAPVVATPDPTPAPAVATPDPTPAPAVTTPDPAPVPAPTPAPAREEGFVLDYDQIASWVTGGFVGVDQAGEAVILGIDAEADNGIILFVNDSTMEAASFVGPITENGNYMTITDETNGLALTFGVTEIGDGTLALDLGELGAATVNAQERDVVLNFIQMTIAGYKLIS